MTRAQAIALMACLMVTAPCAAAVEPDTRDRPTEARAWHAVDFWRQSQGLPQSSVNAIIQTSDGYLWVGTKGGVSRFDGVKFTTFDDRDKAQLLENEAWSLAEGQDGSVWIATYGGGLSRYHHGRFTVYGRGDGLVSDFVSVLAHGHDGTLWIGTDHGLSRFDGSRFVSYTSRDGLPEGAIRALLVDRDGSLWIGGLAGWIARIVGGAVQVGAPTRIEVRSEIRMMTRTKDGSLWIASYDGLFREKDGVARRFTAEDGFPSTRVNRLHEDAAGNLWIGTSTGLYGWQHERFTAHVVATDDISRRHVSAICSDREGSLWIGFSGEGLARLRGGQFTTLTTRDGVPDLYVASVMGDEAGGTWLGTASGLARVADGRVSVYTALEKKWINSMVTDKDGRLWVGTDAGVFRAERPSTCGEPVCADRFAALDTPLGPRPFIRVLYRDRHGVVWAGTTSSGLLRFDSDGEIALLTTREGLSGDAVRALAEDSSGDLWIGTKGAGLTRFANGRFEVFREADGLANDTVQALYTDATGAVWIATRQGVSRWKNGRFATVGVNDGLFSNFVYGFAEDEHGNFWMSCARGVFRVRKQAIDARADGGAAVLTSWAYGFEHGLQSTTAVVGHQPTVHKARDGRVWFGTTLGASVVDPERLQPNSLRPPVHVEQLRIDGQAFDPRGTAEARPGRGDVEIHYTGLSFMAPEKVAFRYRLVPHAPDWVDAGARRVAFYTNLPPGRYRFEVIAANNDGVWNEVGSGVELRIAPHFYQTGWFYGLCAGALALLGAASQRLRVAIVKARERALSRRVDEALAQIKVLRGLLPICAACKKIRDDQGYWNQMETYIHQHSQAEFSHGVCPDCMQRLYPEYAGAARFMRS